MWRKCKAPSKKVKVSIREDKKIPDSRVGGKVGRKMGKKKAERIV